jgi:hypothetical protein
MANRLTRQRYVGHEGGIIHKHRAMLTAMHQPRRFFMAGLLTALVVAFWAVMTGAVVNFWAGTLDFFREVLGMEGNVSIIQYQLGGVFRFSVPHLQFHTGMPSNDTWWAGTIFAAIMILVSLVLPHRFLPVSFLLRIFAFFQGCAQIFFAVWPHAFPYRGSGYIHGNLIACLMLISLIPVLLGFTYFIFDFKLFRKIGLALMMMLHLVIMVPLQYLMQAYLLNHLSLLFMPLLFFVFGLPLNVMVMIAFYSWGFSWQDILHEDMEADAEPLTQVKTGA